MPASDVEHIALSGVTGRTFCNDEKESPHFLRAIDLICKAHSGAECDVVQGSKSRVYPYFGLTYSFSLMVAMVIPIFEVPAWCVANHAQVSPWHSISTCAGNPDDGLRLSGIPYMPLFATFVLEFTIVSVVLLKVVVDYYMFGVRTRHVLNLIFGVISIVDLSISFAIVPSPFRIYPFLRPAFFILGFPGTRMEFLALIQTWKGVLHIFLFIVLFIVMWSWLGALAFHGTPAANIYFTDYPTSIFSMQILLTTANYPDVMMPAYDYSRWSIIYFAIFIMIGLYLFVPLLLGSFFSQFQSVRTAERELREKEKQAKILESYRELTKVDEGAQVLAQYLLVKLLTHLNTSCDEIVVDITDLDRHLKKMDTDGDGTIDMEEYMYWFNNFASTPPPCFAIPQPLEMAWLKNRKLHGRLVAVGGSQALVIGVDILVLINLALQVAAYSQVLADDDPADTSLSFQILEVCFNAMYVIETVLVVIGTGWKFASGNMEGKILILTTAVGFSVSVLSLIFRQSISLINIFVRTIRVIRIVALWESFAILLDSTAYLVAPLCRMLPILAGLYWFYAALGGFIFGGLIYETQPLLVGSSFASAQYWPNNFNDFFSSLVVLFELMIVNNWFVFQDAFVLLTRPEARFFTMSFYVLAVLFTMNVVVSLVIDTFNSQLEAAYQSKDKSRQMNGLSVERLLKGCESMLRMTRSGQETSTKEVEAAVAADTTQKVVEKDRTRNGGEV